jgi:hypothetical protein
VRGCLAFLALPVLVVVACSVDGAVGYGILQSVSAGMCASLVPIAGILGGMPLWGLIMVIVWVAHSRALASGPIPAVLGLAGAGPAVAIAVAVAIDAVFLASPAAGTGLAVAVGAVQFALGLVIALAARDALLTWVSILGEGARHSS